jgi:aspartyl-tRNA(Asn)/glutamyl-tRNA(Gln) amidotransferase subunit C
MSILKEEVKKVADLARLELDDLELEKHTNELNKILNYVQSLDKVDTKDIKPLCTIKGDSGASTPTRHDEIAQSEGLNNFRSMFSSNAPLAEGRFFKVPKMGKE